MLSTMRFGAILAVLMLPGEARAFNQPPTNFGATTFLDGGGAPPGLFLLQYIQHIEGRQARDKDGAPIAGDGRISALVSLTQLFYLSPLKVLGANLGFDLVVPLAAPGVRGSLGPVPLTANTGGLGDLSIGPALQWYGNLLGKPFFHRFETYVIVPSGKYDKAFGANPGSNLVTVEPYYSFTWHFHPAWETSWRFLYAVHGENGETRVRPGQLFHLNAAASWAAIPKLRLGAAGYFLQQTTGDRVAGVDSIGSEERAFALGPGLVYNHPSFLLMLSHPVEFEARNRFEGSRTTLQFLHRF